MLFVLRRFAHYKPMLRQLLRQALEVRDRPVYYRRGDQFRFFIVRRWIQIGIAAVPVAIVAILGYVAFLEGAQSRLAHRHDTKVAELLESYNQLAYDFQHSQERLRNVAEDLETKYRRLRAAAGAANGAVQLAELTAVEESLNRLIAERTNAAQNRERVTTQVAAAHERLANAESANRFRVKSQQIVAQWEWLDRTRERTATEIAALETAATMTGVDLTAIVKDVEGGRTAKGGPYIGLDRVQSELAEIGARPEAFEDELQDLNADIVYLGQIREAMKALPLGKPADGTWLSSRFGRRRDPITGELAFHAGIDFSGLPTTPVTSTAAGVVSFAGRNGPYGNMVEIDHGNGLKTRYGHLRKILVTSKSPVAIGDTIGTMGSTGRSTGTHLHYEVRYKGKNLNPLKFIEAGSHVREQQTTDATPHASNANNPRSN
jgi:murein DD-endopeptidase MepM/ murein hydrolase activator NlpD